MKKIAVITGTRAEYGLLRPLILKLKEDEAFQCSVIVTGAHLSPEFGLTYKEVEKDFSIDEKVEVLMSSDSAVGISKSVGMTIMSFSEVYERCKPDLVVVLGDRYEIFGAVAAATVAKIPVCHLHGGETTEGAFDEAFRHCITKMSYLHFTSTEAYRKRVIQLGENPDRVFNVGAIGIDNIVKLQLLSKEELEESIDFQLDKPYGLVTFHPVTLENSTSEQQVKELFKAMDEMKDMKFIITKANADSDGRVINELIDKYTNENKDKVVSFTSMGLLRYLSAMKYCTLVIGNSSSGILEAPSFKVPTINIGDRQKGRIEAPSVINCEPVAKPIVEAINTGRSEEFLNSIKTMESPYGDGNAANKIYEIVKDTLKKDTISLKKKFYDL